MNINNINEVLYNQIPDEDAARRLVESVNESKKQPEEEETESKKPKNEDDEKAIQPIRMTNLK